MKNVHVLALTIVAVSLLLCGSVQTRAAGCDPIGNVRFICNQVGPEDLAPVPGSEWVLASGMAMNGAIRLVSLRDNTTTVLFPTATPRERLDKKTYGSCPGPIGSEGDKFRAHGLYLRSGSNGVHTLYVVHHGDRESIEVFEFDARPKLPVLTWIGCAVAPDPIGLNSVVGLADGGFITTNFSPRGSDAAARTRMMAGENNGQVWEWHSATGWKVVPGSDAAGPNGLEISKDGKWLYVGGWGSQSVIRLSRGQSPPKKDTVAVGFRVDNLRWAPDGTLLAAGQGGNAPTQTSNVVRVDPATLKFKELVRYPDIEGFGVTTVAIQVGNNLWLGSVRGDRIAIFPLVQSSAGIVGPDQSNQAAVGARLMRGAVDLHYHVDPGYAAYENLNQAKAAGVRALLLKNHFEPTGAIVMLLRPQFPGLDLYSGFVFNRSNGGVNVAGIEYMASISGEPKPGKIVWLPAGDTEKEARGGNNPNPNAPFVAVSRNGQLLPEVKQALAVIAKNNFTLASGHVVPEDALLAFREAKAAGVQRMIATHAADLTGKMTLDQMKEAARLGAWIEFDYRNTLEDNRTDLIRGVGPEHCFISEFWTKNQAPKEYAGAAGVGAFAAEMKRRGFTDRELEMMFKDNPAKAIGLPVVTRSAAN